MTFGNIIASYRKRWALDCGNVGGNASAGGNIECGPVSGSVDAGGKVTIHNN